MMSKRSSSPNCSKGSDSFLYTLKDMRLIVAVGLQSGEPTPSPRPSPGYPGGTGGRGPAPTPGWPGSWQKSSSLTPNNHSRHQQLDRVAVGPPRGEWWRADHLRRPTQRPPVAHWRSVSPPLARQPHRRLPLLPLLPPTTMRTQLRSSRSISRTLAGYLLDMQITFPREKVRIEPGMVHSPTRDR